jgi:hypothetical protein
MAKKSEHAAHSMGKDSKKKPEKKRVHHIHVRRSANKGYIAANHMQPEEGQPPVEPEEHTYPDLAGLQQHMAEHMGPEEEAAEPQESPDEEKKAALMAAMGGGGAPAGGV